MQHALTVSRRIQNVVVKHVDEEIYDYPYRNFLEMQDKDRTNLTGGIKDLAK
jgi:hypothetical protein